MYSRCVYGDVLLQVHVEFNLVRRGALQLECIVSTDVFKFLGNLQREREKERERGLVRMRRVKNRDG